MKTTFKAIIVISIFALLSISCSSELNVKDLPGFWQGESGRGFQFTDKGTYFFYFIENDTWKCSGDSENNFYIDGNKIRCEWIENGETKAISYSVNSFTQYTMKLHSESGDVSDGKYIKVSEPSQINVEDRKAALASSILEQIDVFAEQYYDASTKAFNIKTLKLTGSEKLLKPTYLLDPSVAGELVTKSQKISALAFYAMDNGIRAIYDMPCDQANEAIAKLAAELNHPIDIQFMTGDAPTSEKIKREYEISKERGELAYFWQFQNAILVETGFILAQDPELFFSKISEEQWQQYRQRLISLYDAIVELAKYDEEMASVLEFRDEYKIGTDQERSTANSSIEFAIQFYSTNKENYITRRNALLQ